MPRLQPTKLTDVIGTLDLRPEKSVEDYVLSKQQDAYFVKPPNWDSIGDSVELLYLHNIREYEAMLLLQKDMLENGYRQNSINVMRIAKQGKTTFLLRKRFAEVNSFLKDCHDKKELAMKQIGEEVKMHENLRRKINHCRTNINQLTAFRGVLINTVDEYEHYERVLLDVVEKSDIYDSIKDLMDRCDALMMAQVEITQLDKEKLLEIEEMRKHILAITNQAALTVLGLKTELGDVERSYNRAKQKCVMWENRLEEAKNCTISAKLSRERMLDGIYQLYRMLTKNARVHPKFNRYEVEQQLDYIKEEVETMQSVLATIKAYTQKRDPKKSIQSKRKIPC